MTDRKAFEAWVASAYPESTIYKALDTTSGLWSAWQAATAAERERCAKIAEKFYVTPVGINFEKAADYIRIGIAFSIRKGE